jgi:hypothetical protein
MQMTIYRWQYADDNMQMTICRWQHADDKMQITICRRRYADDNMQMTICRWQYADDNMQMTICRWQYADDNMRNPVSFMHRTFPYKLLFVRNNRHTFACFRAKLDRVQFDMLYFVNCKLVDTRWQQYSTHLHKNSTQNTENGTYITIKNKKLGSAGCALSLPVTPPGICLTTEEKAR